MTESDLVGVGQNGLVQLWALLAGGVHSAALHPQALGLEGCSGHCILGVSLSSPPIGYLITMEMYSLYNKTMFDILHLLALSFADPRSYPLSPPWPRYLLPHTLHLVQVSRQATV